MLIGPPLNLFAASHQSFTAPSRHPPLEIYLKLRIVYQASFIHLALRGYTVCQGARSCPRGEGLHRTAGERKPRHTKV